MPAPRFLKTLLARLRPGAVRIFNWASGKPPSTGFADYAHTLIMPKRLFGIQDRHFWESECRRLTMSSRLKGDDILCRALGRYKMVVYAGDHSLGPNLIADGFWEIWITAMIVKAIEPGMVCIDAGANIGYYTIIMADMASWAGKVIAAEPAPSTFEFLQKNKRLNDEGHIQLLNVAFGAEAGTASFFVPRDEPKNASFFERTDLAPADVETVETRVIPIDALDLPRVDFVKIDVEGAERMVWDGMQQTIARSPDIQIVMEINAARDPDIDGFLAEITALFPLRVVNYWGDPEPITADQIRSDPADVMLYLSRRTPAERKAAKAR